jgi:hypothetical protein
MESRLDKPEYPQELEPFIEALARWVIEAYEQQQQQQQQEQQRQSESTQPTKERFSK